MAVKYAVDNEKAQFLMIGSSTLGLLDAAADTLAGRIDIISLPTVCWGEEHGGPTHSILNDRAKPVGVMMTPDRYESLLETIEILSDKNVLRALKSSQEDFKSGKVHTHEEVWQD